MPFLVEADDPPASDGWGAPARFLIWVALTLALPVVTMPVVRWALRRESNAMTLAALAGYVMASVFAARILLPEAGSGWVGALVLFVAFAASLWYHWHALDLLKRVTAEGSVR